MSDATVRENNPQSNTTTQGDPPSSLLSNQLNLLFGAVSDFLYKQQGQVDTPKNQLKNVLDALSEFIQCQRTGICPKRKSKPKKEPGPGPGPDEDDEDNDDDNLQSILNNLKDVMQGYLDQIRERSKYVNVNTTKKQNQGQGQGQRQGQGQGQGQGQDQQKTPEMSTTKVGDLSVRVITTDANGQQSYTDEFTRIPIELPPQVP